MFILGYQKLVIGITLGLSFLIFGTVFWDSATEDYYNKLNGETYEIDSCMQYMEPPLGSIGDRDDCFRHYEAIGLNTIPVSNIGFLYKRIFGDNMLYLDEKSLYIL